MVAGRFSLSHDLDNTYALRWAIETETPRSARISLNTGRTEVPAGASVAHSSSFDTVRTHWCAATHV